MSKKPIFDLFWKTGVFSVHFTHRYCRRIRRPIWFIFNLLARISNISVRLFTTDIAQVDRGTSLKRFTVWCRSKINILCGVFEATFLLTCKRFLNWIDSSSFGDGNNKQSHTNITYLTDFQNYYGLQLSYVKRNLLEGRIETLKFLLFNKTGESMTPRKQCLHFVS